MKTKKFLSIVLSILMLTGIFAVNASAVELEKTDVILAGTVISGTEESYWLTVDGALTADGASAANYNISITPATETAATKVTVKDAQFSVTSLIGGEHCYAIGSSSALDVEIQGTNKIDVHPDSYAMSCGIVSGEAIKIYGNGSLEMNIGNINTVLAQGVNGNTVDISGDAALTLNLSSVFEMNGGYSLYATTLSDNASLTINETFITGSIPGVNSEEAEDLVAVGYKITYEGLKLSDNAKISVKVLNPDSVKNSNQGFNIKGNIELSGNSQLSAIGCDGLASAGIAMNNGSLTVSGTSTVTAAAGNAYGDRAYGIYCYNGSASNLNVTASDNAKIIATCGNAFDENAGLLAYADLTVTDNAYVSGTSGNAEESGSAGVAVTGDITLSEKATLIGKSGDAGDMSYGINTNGNITAGDESVIEGFSGEGGGKSYGVHCNNILINGNAKLTGESESSIESESAGILAKETFKAHDNAVINANGSEGIISYGLVADDITVYGSAAINAASGKASESSVGMFIKGTALITENAKVNTKSGEATLSCGVFGSDNVSNEFIVSGNAVINAESSKATANSIAFFAPASVTVTNNAKITAKAGESETISVGFASADAKINSPATVEASGLFSAFYSNQDFDILGYTDPYIIVSKDTNPENATAWDGTSSLVSIETSYPDDIVPSEYKYVLIAPEKPAEPEEPDTPEDPDEPDTPEDPENPEEPEPTIFEQILSYIVSAFESIANFFTWLFSIFG